MTPSTELVEAEPQFVSAPDAPLCSRPDLADTAFVHAGVLAAVAVYVVLEILVSPAGTLEPRDRYTPQMQDTCATHVVSPEVFTRWARHLLDRRAAA